MAEFINTVDVLGDNALTNSIIDGSITEIADNFVKVVGDFALRGCSALISANFVEATSVGGMSFYGCSKLTTADFPAATSIGNSAFYDCSALNKVNFPVATSIGNGTFNGCYNLATADFPAVKTIDSTAFMYCSRLTALILRSGTLATLGNANSLEGTPIESGKGYIYVPSALYDSYKADSVWFAFANQFRKLEDYTVDGTITGEIDLNRHMVRFFAEDGTFLCYVMVPNGGTAVYPGDEPVKDGEYAFNGWSPAPTNVTADMDCYAQFRSTAIVSRKLVERTISGNYENNRVETIGESAFRSCYELTEVSFPAATYIGNSAFQGCSKLTTANFPLVTSIGTQAFYGCSALTTVDFSAVASIARSAFASCSSLVALILRNAENVAALTSTSGFNSTPISNGTGYIYVPRTMADGSDGVEAYKAATNWSRYSSQIRAIEDYPEITGGDN